VPSPDDPSPAFSADASDEIDGAHLLLVGAAVLLLAALYLSPLLSFTYFGSDTGEYYRLTVDLASTGHLPIGGGYGGWGTGYPDFPGLFVIGASTAQATGVGALPVLLAAVPILSAAAVAPLFLLFRRVFPNDSIALLGAAFAGVAMPRAFSLAHPAPLAIGDLLGVAALWMFVEGRRDLRWYLPLSLTSGALLLTHHLSSYFFVVGALGSLLLVELIRPRAWSDRFPAREIGFSVALLVAMDAFWFGAAPDFVSTVIGPSKLLGLSAAGIGVGLGVGAVVAGLLVGLVIRFRRAHPHRSLRASLPSDRSVLRDAVVITVGIVVGLGALLVVPLPGTTQHATVAEIAFYSPLLALLVIAAGTRRLLSLSTLGPWGLAFVAALGGSAIFGLASQSTVILPARHAEYLVIPLGLLAALAIGRLVARADDAGGRRAAGAVAAASLLLLAANAAIAFPPPQDLGNFQEGLTSRDAQIALWSSSELPPSSVVASDHRLSSMLFGFDGLRATWDSTPVLFTGSNASLAEGELRASQAPDQRLTVTAVAVDGVMRTVGVALDPNAPAAPMSAAAVAWFDGPGFVPIYENQDETVYWVDGLPLS
jgi:hypothetical protein